MAAFRVLIVCTANHCRSPIAEQLLQSAIAQRFAGLDEWAVESAGTDIPGPWPLHPSATSVLAERLPMVAEHYSRQLKPAMIQRADLVLTATRKHRGVVVSYVPAAVGRTFTILQFARLCDQVQPITAGEPGEAGRPGGRSQAGPLVFAAGTWRGGRSAGPDGAGYRRVRGVRGSSAGCRRPDLASPLGPLPPA